MTDKKLKNWRIWRFYYPSWSKVSSPSSPGVWKAYTQNCQSVWKIYLSTPKAQCIRTILTSAEKVLTSIFVDVQCQRLPHCLYRYLKEQLTKLSIEVEHLTQSSKLFSLRRPPSAWAAHWDQSCWSADTTQEEHMISTLVQICWSLYLSCVWTEN